MKKFIYILILLGIIFIGDRLLAQFLANIVLTSGTKFSRIYRGGQSNDVLILGNSRGENSFSTKDIMDRTGLTTFQLSHKGVSTEIIECLLKDYLSNNSPPKIILLEVTNLITTNTALYDLKSYMYWSDNFSELLKKEDYTSFLATKLSNLYIWNGEIIFRSIYFIGKTDQNTLIHKTKKLEADTLKKRLLASEAQGDYNLKPLESNLNSLEGIIQLANEKNITIHLIFPPWVPQYSKLTSKSRYDILKKLSKFTSDKVFIHDMSNSITDLQMFEDLTHLNYYGSKKLLELMLNKNILLQRKL
jgi:hypothetical protein